MTTILAKPKDHHAAAMRLPIKAIDKDQFMPTPQKADIATLSVQDPAVGNSFDVVPAGARTSAGERWI